LGLVEFYNYLNEVLIKITDSYKIIEHLKDNPGDLEIIKKELAKITGLLKVTRKKLESIDDNSDKFVKLLTTANFFLENYSFEREIETMSKLYSEDSHRLKNIRYSIIEALNEKKLIETIYSIIGTS
jgi:phage-related protein